METYPTTAYSTAACCSTPPKGDVSDRIFKRKLNGIISGLDELSAELKVTRDALLNGGKITFNSLGTVAELRDLADEVAESRLDEFEESYPPNKGTA